ncbi:MAG: glycosyltransferase family 4 protein [Candidatus Omnitrophota bacterium]
MNILHVAPIRFDRFSGVSNYVVELTKALVDTADCHVCVLCSLAEEVLKEKLFLHKKIILIKGLKKEHQNPFFLDNVWIDKILTEFGHPDIVHFHGVYRPFHSALARLIVRKGWKYIVSPHGGLFDGAQRRKPLKKFFGNVLFFDTFMRQATAVYVLNEAEEKIVKKRYPGKMTTVIPNGISFESFSKIYMKSSSSDNCLIFGFIGRIDIDHKGIDLLLNSFSIVGAQFPNLRWKLVIVGSFFSSRDQQIFNRLLMRLGNFSDRVILSGALGGEDKWRAMSSFDVFVHTSRYEGMPTAVIEAMAMGKPCVVTPGTNMQEIIRNGDGGWLCDANVNSIFETLKFIFDHRAEIPIKGKNAQEYAKQNLTWDKIAIDYISKVSNLIS